MTVSCGPPQFKLLKNTMREVDGNGLMKGECEARERKSMGVCVGWKLEGQGRGRKGYGRVSGQWGYFWYGGEFLGSIWKSKKCYHKKVSDSGLD